MFILAKFAWDWKTLFILSMVGFLLLIIFACICKFWDEKKLKKAKEALKAADDGSALQRQIFAKILKSYGYLIKAEGQDGWINFKTEIDCRRKPKLAQLIDIEHQRALRKDLGLPEPKKVVSADNKKTFVCSECGTENSSSAQYCKRCGAESSI